MRGSALPQTNMEAQLRPYGLYSNLLRGVLKGFFLGSTIGFIKGDSRSLDCSSNSRGATVPFSKGYTSLRRGTKHDLDFMARVR